MNQKMFKSGVIGIPNPPVSKSKKPLIIGAIVLALVVILVLFVFIGQKQFAGQAIFTGTETMYTAGFKGNVNDLLGKKIFPFNVYGNLGNKKSVAVSFELLFPNSLTVTEMDVTGYQESDKKWGSQFKKVKIDGNKIIFEHATFDFKKSISGANVPLARIQFKVKPGASPLNASSVRDLKFTKLEVLDLDSPNGAVNIIKWIKNPGEEVMVVEAKPEACPEQETCPTCPAVEATCDYSYAGGCGETCEANKATTCQGLIELKSCPEQKVCAECPTCPTAGAKYNADLTSDGKIDGQDADIIFKTKLAKLDNSCGSAGGSTCQFGKLYVCDDASFKLNSGGTCPLEMGGQ